MISKIPKYNKYGWETPETYKIHQWLEYQYKLEKQRRINEKYRREKAEEVAKALRSSMNAE